MHILYNYSDLRTKTVGIARILRAGDGGGDVRSVSCGRITFFVLYTAILEPDFHLFLGQLETICNLDATQSCEILAFHEFMFELQELCTGEGGTDTFAGFGIVLIGSG